MQFYQLELPGGLAMSPYHNGFAPVAGREELRSAMRNRFYNDVSRPGHYGFHGIPHDVVTADMTPLGAMRRPRSVRGLGNVCDDEGAALGMNIFGAIVGTIGTAIGASGAGTTNADGTITGGDAGRRAAGGAVASAGNAAINAWTSACLTAERGAATGATPTESLDSVLARARAEWAATADADRDMTVTLERERQAREDERATQTRNLIIGLVAGAVVLGGVVYIARR